MNENIQLLQAFLKNPGKVGSITPSSPELAAEMLHGVRPDAENIVLELGVGTGAITKYLEEIIPDRESYLGIELDSGLVENLQKSYPDLNVVCGNATEAYEIHRRSGLGKVRYLVCCLPFVSLPKEVSEQVLAEIEKFMAEGCELRIFQYAHGYYLPPAIKIREYLRDRYGKSRRSQLILKNLPPAFTLTWSTV
jgi:phosphatidylethanolamine/phosphatidyl-N-methylethanolamine N-methyltransferase